MRGIFGDGVVLNEHLGDLLADVLRRSHRAPAPRHYLDSVVGSRIEGIRTHGFSKLERLFELTLVLTATSAGRLIFIERFAVAGPLLSSRFSSSGGGAG